MKQHLHNALLGTPTLRGTTLALLLAAALLLPRPAAALVSPHCNDSSPVTYTQKVGDRTDRIVMEAERPTKSAASTRAGHSAEVAWSEFTSNRAGNSAYVRIPTTGKDLYDLPANGATLSYQINFAKTGTYYVHMRYRADTDADNSVRLALDGQLFLETWHMDVTNTEWAWAVAPVTMQVTTTGAHSFTVHQREDGLYLDRILITTVAGTSVTDFGPNVTETVHSNAVKQPFQRIGYSEDSRTGHGFVTIEAEAPTNEVAGSRAYECRSWKVGHDPAASTGCYMITPENGEKSDSFNFRQAPRLDFELEMDRTENYYIHIRHKGTSLNNSAWITVNDRLISRFHLSLNNTAWVWDKAPETFVRPDGNGNVMFSVYMREDNTPIDKIILTTDPNFVPSGFGPAMTIESPPDLVFYQGNDVDHTVDLPLELPSRNRAGIFEYESLQWKYFRDTNAIYNYYAMVENSGTDPILNNELSHKAPLEEFDINFTQTGTHYLFVRHAAPDNSNNSFTYYLDGVKIQEYHINQYSPGAWTYYIDNPATFNVTTPGLHTLGIAMREDGTPLDHIVITTNANYMQPAALPMPITLVDFTAVADGAHNRLAWTSSFESNTDHHLVERSRDGRGDQWEVIGRVAAAGHSEQFLDYGFIDEQPYARSYYRLTTVDFDGTSSTSSIVTVERQSSATRLSVYPNPTADLAVLSFDHRGGTEALLRLTSLSGQVLADRTVTVTAGSNQVEIPLERFAPGTYILSVMLGGELQTQRIVVTR